MRTSILLAVAVLLGVTSFSLRADYLKNGDMKDRVANWRGDGEAAFLNPDGTEGAEGDKGVIPVIKIALSKGHSRAITQDFETKENGAAPRVHVEVFASADFKRSKFDSDYSPDIDWKPGSTWYWGPGAIPKVDFWIQLSPGVCYKLSNLKSGQWTNVDGKWDTGMPAQNYTVSFIVPPGEGAIYIRKASATP
jgi:hypothetical protein